MKILYSLFTQPHVDLFLSIHFQPILFLQIQILELILYATITMYFIVSLFFITIYFTIIYSIFSVFLFNNYKTFSLLIMVNYFFSKVRHYFTLILLKTSV